MTKNDTSNAQHEAALTLMRDASRTRGALCPACGWNEPRWIASRVGAHIRTCEALAAQVKIADDDTK